MNKNLIFAGLIALIVSIASILAFRQLEDRKTIQIEHITSNPSRPALYPLDDEGKSSSLDFKETAKKVINGVVHIKSTVMYDQLESPQYDRSIPDPFRDFFGDEFERFFRRPAPQQPDGQRPARVGQGSGVIVNQDGYIVTNNHVIANAQDVEVTLHDNRSYKATVIGTDPSTDLAVIQIKEKGLTTVPFANSDEIEVGEWVLAVGNPMGLTSTVTAGIVSAKGRNINVVRDRYAIENFIQTDAAINPGNSGGALVNLAGGLVGINTAIASPTGTFAGYGFAIPANIVSKVIKDLIEFGMVQRGVLGILIRTVDGNLAKAEDLDVTVGVFVDSLVDNSAAGAAGVLKGDVITAVDGTPVNSSPELQGIIAQHRPGEIVILDILRDGKEKSFEVILNNREGKPIMSDKESIVMRSLGAEFGELKSETAKKLDIEGGVAVKKLYAGKIRRDTQMKEGFIITHVNGKKVTSVDALKKQLEGFEGGVMLEGVYEDIPGRHYYAFGM